MPEKIILNANIQVEVREIDRRSLSRGLSHPHMLPISSELLDNQSHLTSSGFSVALTTATDVPVSLPEQMPDRP